MKTPSVASTSHIVSISTFLFFFLLAGCTVVPSSAGVSGYLGENLISATKIPISTSSPLPSLTPIPATPTVHLPPPVLPPVYTSGLLRGGSKPQTYLADTCEYLRARWDAGNSAPGTVVMPIMYHTVTREDKTLPTSYAIYRSYLEATLARAHELGFETITIRELVSFLEHNAPIPRRSLILIQDDRSPGNFVMAFQPLLEKYDWTLTWAWPIGDSDRRSAVFISEAPREPYLTLWEQMQGYYATGRLDMQAHGYDHLIIDDYFREEVILNELQRSREALRERFYCVDDLTPLPRGECMSEEPLAYIWPGGGFSKRAVELAREAGYRVGFTTFPRGAVMFNWVPLGEALSANHPYWLPEAPVGDPLMVLPRYWSTNALKMLDEVVTISEEAAAYARQNRATELLYYERVCVLRTGALGDIHP